jgi:cell division protein FtsA
VVGIGQQVSQGVKAGTIVDMETAESSIRAAVHGAEQMAGTTIEHIVINLSGGYPASTSVGVEVSVDGHEVGDNDLRRAVDECHHRDGQNGHQDPNRRLVHSIPTSYTIDGSRGIRDPRGMFGERLGVSMHFITANTGAVRNLLNCVQRCHLEAVGLVVSPYASGLACLADDEMELGVTVVDMGGGTTSIAVFYEGNVIYTSVAPVGGHHVTTDIARGLSTPLANAERMKTLYGHALAAEVDDRSVIEVPQVGEGEDGQPQQVPRSLLTGIIQPRLEETFELVRSRLEESGMNRIAGRRVMLTGGACQLPGVRDLAALILDKQVRIGRPVRALGLAEATGGPAYATCAGLLAYAQAADRARPVEPPAQVFEPAGLVGRFGQWFREHF